MVLSTKSPAAPFYGYQRRYLADKSRFKVARWSRQTGKDHTQSFEIVDDVAGHEAEGLSTRWILAGASQRQAHELAQKVRMHMRAFQLAALSMGEDYFEDTRFKAYEFEFPAGSRIIVVPASPETIRGFTGNVAITELGLVKNDRELWRALAPAITRGYKIRCISTPRGKLNKFYEICTDPSWSEHVVTIHDAIEQGLPADAGELRRLMGSDEEGWRQEYLVEFVDEATAFLTHELIASCEDALAGDPNLYAGGDLYAGVDIGRRHDLTVIWIIEAVGDVAWTREVIVLAKTKFSIQQELLFSVLRRRGVRRCCIDETGLGMQLAENAADAFPAVVEPVTLSARTKEALASALRSEFEDRLLRIPVDNDIRSDLHSVKRTVTAAGNIRFDAERTDDGHADRFWALALAREAWKGGERMRLSGRPAIFHGRDLCRVA